MKQRPAPEAGNLINKEIGICASFSSEEGRCVGESNFYICSLFCAVLQRMCTLVILKH